MAGCARGLWLPQDALQPIRANPAWISSTESAVDRGPPDRLMIDSTHLRAHRTAARLLKRGIHPSHRPHQRSDSTPAARGLRWRRSVILLLTEEQMSDHKGAALIYPMLPDAATLIADKGYDSNAFPGRLSPDAASRLAFHRAPSAGCPQHTARLCIDSVTRSRRCSQS